MISWSRAGGDAGPRPAITFGGSRLGRRKKELITEVDVVWLGAAGFSDIDILDITLLICYRHFIGRLSYALGVEVACLPICRPHPPRPVVS